MVRTQTGVSWSGRRREGQLKTPLVGLKEVVEVTEHDPQFYEFGMPFSEEWANFGLWEYYSLTVAGMTEATTVSTQTLPGSFEDEDQCRLQIPTAGISSPNLTLGTEQTSITDGPELRSVPPTDREDTPMELTSRSTSHEEPPASPPQPRASPARAAEPLAPVAGLTPRAPPTAPLVKTTMVELRSSRPEPLTLQLILTTVCQENLSRQRARFAEGAPGARPGPRAFASLGPPPALRSPLPADPGARSSSSETEAPVPGERLPRPGEKASAKGTLHSGLGAPARPGAPAVNIPNLPRPQNPGRAPSSDGLDSEGPSADSEELAPAWARRSASAVGSSGLDTTSPVSAARAPGASSPGSATSSGAESLPLLPSSSASPRPGRPRAPPLSPATGRQPSRPLLHLLEEGEGRGVLEPSWVTMAAGVVAWATAPGGACRGQRAFPPPEASLELAARLEASGSDTLEDEGAEEEQEEGEEEANDSHTDAEISSLASGLAYSERARSTATRVESLGSSPPEAPPDKAATSDSEEDEEEEEEEEEDDSGEPEATSGELDVASSEPPVAYSRREGGPAAYYYYSCQHHQQQEEVEEASMDDGGRVSPWALSAGGSSRHWRAVGGKSEQGAPSPGGEPQAPGMRPRGDGLKPSRPPQRRPPPPFDPAAVSRLNTSLWVFEHFQALARRPPPLLLHAGDAGKSQLRHPHLPPPPPPPPHRPLRRLSPPPRPPAAGPGPRFELEPEERALIDLLASADSSPRPAVPDSRLIWVPTSDREYWAAFYFTGLEAAHQLLRQRWWECRRQAKTV
ncbi:nascent polypeptide-associated complex subunit alpha, muscle-specific form-like isoform X2 [Heterodontus francisci]|uniref:nascent polypeptide-associated complex subunit alpha, muscle-specific form-like isoform X2 n=1 Tax=Heterodontus francisci TaxID=7792 RepID=UPI00355AD414